MARKERISRKRTVVTTIVAKYIEYDTASEFATKTPKRAEIPPIIALSHADSTYAIEFNR